jgi:YHS domain-containing protein
MKPLELTIFPKPERPRFTYTGDHVSAMMRERKRERALIVAKRLTDAELAAEYHRATYYFRSSADMHSILENEETAVAMDRDLGWMYAMERFATLPHYDEVDA